MAEPQIKDQQGLSSLQAEKLQKEFGKNELVNEKKEGFFRKILQVVREPMFLLLIVAAIIYFILGEQRDGAIMLVFVVAIISIEVIQEWKTDQTLAALKDLSAPRIIVLRDGIEKEINSSDLVPGDVMLVAEGVKIPADGTVLKANTLRVDESSLTGEAEGVWKVPSGTADEKSAEHWRRDYCYAGTLVTQGTGSILIDKIGLATEYGKIGKSVMSAPDNPTPLQQQTERLVKLCAGIAAVLFALVGTVTYFNIPDHATNDRIVESVLSGITIAMAMIPEEFPVVLTVFLSMGAWRLAKKHSLVRKLASVETLGAVSVLCVDKTGTITMNRMKVQESWSFTEDVTRLHQIMGMACEPDAYDPMEKAMIEHCEEQGISRDSLFDGKLIKEYAFTDEAKMMGHVWNKEQTIVVASKGSPENILTICKLTPEEKTLSESKITELSNRGLRVIAVGEMVISDPNAVPETLQQCSLQLCGMIGLADPPRESVKQDIETCTKAGIRVVMITGDNGITAGAIARQISMPNSDKIITGDELNGMSDEELKAIVKDVSVFSRVVPAHKMRIIQAFKGNGEIVAMTGDGVNDAPALKYADIGIAMGKRGSEVSREAADIILLDDNFSTIVDTIKDGRRIYDNIKKAVEYIFAIHVPIAGAALFAPMIGISPANLLLLPLHVVLLELVIDPTCSIVLERQPAEKDIMERAPRDPNAKLITMKTITKSLLQGGVIFGASFGAYVLFLNQYPDNAPLARSMGLTIIFLANILLVHVNSSNSEFAITSLISLTHDKVQLAVNFGTIAGLLIVLYTPLNTILKLAPLSVYQMLLAAGIACVAVLWYELVKLVKVGILNKERE
jgi:Ca2+-transporting ATPase